MKPATILIGCLAALSGRMCLAAAATDTKSVWPRAGVYDSRLVAYAHFWSGPRQKQLKSLAEAAKAARAAGDQDRTRALEQQLREGQSRIHLQVFSTAPCDEALAALKECLPEILKEAGIRELISIWDEEGLRKYPEDRRIDVTDRLVREFQVPQARAKGLDGMRRTTPLPLDEARKLDAAGKL